MLQRLLSKKQPHTLSGLLPKISQYSVVVTMLSSALFLMPSAHAASCKIPKSYYKNVSCTASSSYFLAIKDFGAPVALIDKKGKRVVDLSRYQKVDADKLSGGLLPVLRNSRVGYLNMQGREVVPAMYDILTESQGWARPVSDGRIVVNSPVRVFAFTISLQTFSLVSLCTASEALILSCPSVILALPFTTS